MPWLNAFLHRLPDELVNLQAEPRVQAIGENPFHQFAWIEKAVAGVARRSCIFAEGRREEYVAQLLFELMLTHKIPRELVVGSIGDDKLQLVGRSERIEVGRAKAPSLSRSGTLHIDNLVNCFRHVLQRTLSAGLDQHLIAVVEELLHERHYLALLQHRFSAGNFHQLDRSKRAYSAHHLIDRGFVSAREGVLAVAP